MLDIEPPKSACHPSASLLAWKNSHRWFVEGCQTVMCASGPEAGTAVGGMGTASKVFCRPSFHEPGDNVTRTLG